MAKESGFKWKVGMFVTIGLILLMAAVYFIGKQKNLFGSTIRVKAVFETVGGLKVGNNVRLAGITIGTVDNIELLSDTSVLVEMLIEKDAQKFIKKDAVARVGADGLMGDKTVIITPGKASQTEVVKNNAYLKSKAPLDVDSITMSLRNTLANTEMITGQISQIAYKINNGNGALSRLISDKSLSNDLTSTMENLKKSSSGLSENMEAAKDNILLRGYYKKKEKAVENAEKEKQKALKEQQEKEERERKRLEKEQKKELKKSTRKERRGSKDSATKTSPRDTAK
ncbi:MAG: MCE family protein [Sphingobacteriales bacterium]|nr:MAG: MCE family protein [Sphingobacteriales bacterium]